MKLTPKQQEAYALAKSPARFILFRGGSRSGKSFAILYFIIVRALICPKSRHGIFRHTAVDVRRTLLDLTFKQVLDAAYPGLWQELKDKRLINDTEMTVEFPNGSIILFNGLDDATKQERILGDEYSTVFVNEATQFRNFEIIQKLMSRLSLELPIEGLADRKLSPKLFVDCNPAGKRHWTFKAFVEKVNPVDSAPWPRPDQWCELHMNPEHNRDNISSTYLEDLTNLSARERRRFLEGEWLNETENALFDVSWIADARLTTRDNADDLKRVIVAIDPAVSSHAGSDETGIIVAGVDDDGHCYVLEDCSLKAQPQTWAERALEAYERWQADTIVAEKNQGGDLVSHTLRTVNQSVPVKLVHASRSKTIRAEPVSALYEQGKVHHCGSFEKLEGQLEDFTIDFDRRKNGSPDRLDALVWAISELAVTEREKRGGSQQRVSGFWR